MATAPQTREVLTLEEFLRRPEIDEKPYLEYIDGRIEAKAVAQMKHCVIQKRIGGAFDQFSEPQRLGSAFPELRCTFANRSIVPDVVFLLEEHIAVDAEGVVVNETLIPPDIMVEIISPDQTVKSAHEKLLHATAHGTGLGLLIHPERLTIDVYRPGRPPERLADDGAIEGEPILPGFRLPVAEVFGWLVRRRPGGGV